MEKENYKLTEKILEAIKPFRPVAEAMGLSEEILEMTLEFSDRIIKKISVGTVYNS